MNRSVTITLIVLAALAVLAMAYFVQPDKTVKDSSSPKDSPPINKTVEIPKSAPHAAPVAPIAENRASAPSSVISLETTPPAPAAAASPAPLTSTPAVTARTPLPEPAATSIPQLSIPTTQSGSISPATPAPIAELPPAATAPTATTAPANFGVPQSYTVVSGDTLSHIALKVYGRQSLWPLLAKANPQLDPQRLQIGQKLRVPPLPVSISTAGSPPAGSLSAGSTSTSSITATTHPATNAGAAGASGKIYLVQEGDTLSSIAQKQYNDQTLWTIIYHANRETLGSKPDRLVIGMKLIIPANSEP